MNKDKIDFKLVNMAIITFIIFLIYQMKGFWGNFLWKISLIIMPFILAFIIAYAFYPLLKFLRKKGVPKVLSIIFIVLIFISLFSLVAILIIPLLTVQLSNLFNKIIFFIKEIASKHNLEIGPLQEGLTSTFNSVLFSLSSYVSGGAINFINLSLNFIVNFLIVFSVSIYFLIDMEKMSNFVKGHLKKRNPRTYLYCTMLDQEMKSYILGMMKIVCITFFEYTIAYSIVGHPYALLLGLLTALCNLIPFFGAMCINAIAAITAAVSFPFPSLLIKTLIAIAIISIADTYVINPNVFKRTNRVHPIIVILAVFGGGYFFGILGIFLSIPVAIFIMTTYKFYKIDIHTKISDFKAINKKEKS